MTDKNDYIDEEELRKEAKLKGKVSFLAWSMAQLSGQDPVIYQRELREKSNRKLLAYSAYVRYDDEVSPDKHEPQEGGKKLSQVDFTLEDVKRVIDERVVAERDHTRSMIKEGVNELRDELSAQFQSFIKDNFEPGMDDIDKRFDRLEDRVDHLASDVAELRIDTRHLKQDLRTRGLSAPA